MTDSKITSEWKVEPWEDGEVVLTYGGKPQGKTLDRIEAYMIRSWLLTVPAIAEVPNMVAVLRELQSPEPDIDMDVIHRARAILARIDGDDA